MPCARSVLLVMLLLAGSLSPPAVWGQDARAAPPEPSRGFSLEQNYPSPVSESTSIPFHLDGSLFEERDSVVVTMRIFNILRQVVAIPEAVEQGESQKARVINLAYREPGRKVAYWDGRDSAGRRVPSGVYYCQLIVDDQPQTRKIIVLNPRRRRGLIPLFGSRRDRSP